MAFADLKREIWKHFLIYHLFNVWSIDVLGTIQKNMMKSKIIPIVSEQTFGRESIKDLT